MPLKDLKKIKKAISVSPPKIGEIIAGKIINKSRNSVFLELGPQGIGVIRGQEFYKTKQALKDFTKKDNIFVKIIGLETEEGYRELSLLQANKQITWDRLTEIQKNDKAFKVKVKSANKGGLICQVEEMDAFLPVSQLSPSHYPKVENGDPSKIAKELQKFIGKELKVKILSIDQKKNQIILSEKITLKQAKKESREKENIALEYKVGDVVEGKISGITNFGAFVKLKNGIEGLVRAEDIPDKKDKKPFEIKIGEKLKAKIIEKTNDKIYLSLKT